MSADYFTTVEGVDEAMRVCSAIQIEATMTQLLNSKEDSKTLMNQILANEVVRMSTMHISYVSFKIFVERLRLLPEKSLIGHFENMACLAGLQMLQSNLAVGFDGGYFKQGDRALV